MSVVPSTKAPRPEGRGGFADGISSLLLQLPGQYRFAVYLIGRVIGRLLLWAKPAKLLSCRESVRPVENGLVVLTLFYLAVSTSDKTSRATAVACREFGPSQELCDVSSRHGMIHFPVEKAGVQPDLRG